MTGVDVTAATQPLLSVRGLVTEFMTDEGVLRAVDDVSFDLDRGETLAIVGESGSGKSVTALSILQLLPSRKAKIAAGEILFDGVDLRRQSTKALRTLRGKAITMVFQDAMAYLNPTLPVGRQLGEAIRTHDRSISKRGAEARAAELLELVGITRSRERLREYPHEFSGGMLQRVMIAMAIANGPRLLIADEPTTALDVTIQAQIVEILKRVQEETGTSLILITHDIGLAADMVDRVVVMYAGRVVETGRIEDILHAPRHPYTIGLLESIPALDVAVHRLPAIPGQPPVRLAGGAECRFRDRCGLTNGRARCEVETPALVEVAIGQAVACHFAGESEDWRRRRAQESAKLGVST